MFLKSSASHGEINFGLGAGRADFAIGGPAAAAAFVRFVGASFAWHKGVI